MTQSARTGRWPLARLDLPALVPGLIAVALFLVWSEHDGGYDQDTWYWGALVLLATLAVGLVLGDVRRRPRSRSILAALVALTLYVGWSYLSIAWARTPGDALTGSNRALLYLIVFALFATLPWTPRAALGTLLAFTSGVGVIAVVVLVRLATAGAVTSLLSEGRLVAPTGYFNSSVALFMTAALVASALATRRELPGMLRGGLIAFASAGLQLAVIGQSRGWLFTLPFVLALGFWVLRDRLRTAAAAILPAAAALAPVHQLLGVFNHTGAASLHHASRSAGGTALVLTATMFVAGTLISWGDGELRDVVVPPRHRRRLSATLAAVAGLVIAIGALGATHGDPIGFVKRQWNGFSHPSPKNVGGSYFATVGSGRYDFWRVSLDAFAAAPVGGLGQDNFTDYYVSRRRTREEPAWTHSLELRLLAHTGGGGVLLFSAFLVLAVRAGVRTVIQSGPLRAAIAAAAMLPLIDWALHGSVDWFWEVPALSGPAFGFLAMAGALGAAPASARGPARDAFRLPGPLALVAGGVALLLAVAALGFPYLSVREVSTATDFAGGGNPAAALSALARAADLDPLSSAPGRIGGSLALQVGLLNEARQRFRQAIDREPDGWFSWLGEGLAQSALGNTAQARSDYARAEALNDQQPAIKLALARVESTRPMTPHAAFRLLVAAP